MKIYYKTYYITIIIIFWWSMKWTAMYNIFGKHCNGVRLPHLPAGKNTTIPWNQAYNNPRRRRFSTTHAITSR